MKKRIYFDFAAATPVLPEIMEVYTQASQSFWANPSAIHREGQMAKAAFDQAKSDISQLINCLPSELICTSSATESNNLAIKGILGSNSATEKEAKISLTNDIPHILISSIEHQSITKTVQYLAKSGQCAFDYIPITVEGLLDLTKLSQYIKPHTRLISLIWVSNEIGTVQLLEEVVNLLAEINRERKVLGLSKVLLHTDASQTFLIRNIDLKALKVDLLTLSGHKLYAPRGTGVLFVRKGITFDPIFFGGGQERGFRSGTEDVAGLLALVAAMDLAQTNREEFRKEMKVLQDYTFQKLIEINQKDDHFLANKVIINGAIEHRAENNVNFSLKSFDHQTLHTALDLAGVAISGGSSCASGSLELSSVVRAVRLAQTGILPEQEATIRLSFGRGNTIAEVDFFILALLDAVERIRG